jgi:hypothetical protein
MSDQNKQTDMQLVDPGPLDFKRAEQIVKRVIKENVEWLKEMAKR